MRVFLARLAAALAAGLLAASCALAPAPAGPVALRLVAFNDFHGHLEPPGGTGGAAHLATAIRELRDGAPHAAVVAAGDLVGASPLVSSLFLDEPTITALGEAGLEFSAPGNHEFDRGRDELQRLVQGGCHPKEGCFAGPWAGARFGYLAANVFDTETGRTLFPPYAIRHYDGVPVAFVGAVLRSTPSVVDRRGIGGLAFRDEADSVNARVPELRRQGVEAIVLLLHEGGVPKGKLDDPACPGFEGAVVDIVKRLDPAVDVVVSGHTHQVYRCRVDGRLVTSAGSYGRWVTTIDLAIDRATRDVIAAEARSHVVDAGRFPADAAITAHVARFAALAGTRAGRVVGTVQGEFTPIANGAGESNLGELVAAAQLAAMREAAGAQVAFTNPGGLRAPLASRRPDGAVTYGDVFSVQPFGNTLVAVTLTGAQLLRLLEQQWREAPDRTRILPAAGLDYAWDPRRPRGSRVVPGSVRVAGQPLEAARDYRVAVNSFLHGGGDGFTVFGEGRDPVGGPVDVDALAGFIAASRPVAAPPRGAIRRLDGG